MKPDARTKAWLKDNGWYPWRVEQWNSFIHKKTDLFNICDYVALKVGEPGIFGLQITGGEHLAAHRTDLLGDPVKAPSLYLWLRCANPFELHSWSKRGPQGKRKLWTLHRERAILSPTGNVSFEVVE